MKDALLAPRARAKGNGGGQEGNRSLGAVLCDLRQLDPRAPRRFVGCPVSRLF